MASVTNDDTPREYFDIAIFVKHYQILEKFYKPFCRLYNGIKSFLLLKSPYQAVLAWIALLVNCFLPSGCVIVFILLKVSFLVAVGLFQNKTKLFKKMFPDWDYESSENELKEEVVKEKKSYNVTLAEFRDWVICGCSVISLVIFLCGLNAALLLLLTSNIVFMMFYQQKANLSEHFDNVHGSQTNEIDEDACDTVDSGESSELGLDQNKEMNEIVAGNQNESFKENKTPLMKSLLKLRKRYKQSETCSSCHVQLSSFLKRSHICVNCAQVFCQKCCTLQVPKSVLGVTAPATCNDVVPICFPCHSQYTKT